MLSQTRTIVTGLRWFAEAKHVGTHDHFPNRLSLSLDTHTFRVPGHALRMRYAVSLPYFVAGPAPCHSGKHIRDFYDES